VYLNNLKDQFASLPAKNPYASDITTLKAVEDALRVRAAYSIFVSVVQGIVKAKDTIKGRTLFNEVYQQDQIAFSTNHLVYYSIWAARNHLEKSQIKCPNLKKHLESLFTVYGLMELQKDPVSLFECGYYQPHHAQVISDAIKLYVKALRPQHVSLIEAFDVPDSVLNTAIGNKYGDIYE